MSEAIAPQASWWRRRVVAPIAAQLRQGTSPREVALTLSVGAALGIFPILGATTSLCVLAGVALRLNHALLQLVNYLVYPAQLALLIPFWRAGEKLFGATPVPLADIKGLMQRFELDPWRFVLDYAAVAGYGVVAWLLAAVPLTVLAYYGLRPVLRRLGSRSA